MSHYSVLVLLDELDGDPNDAVEKVLAPYDENLGVPEHEAKCYCVGRDGKAEQGCEDCAGAGQRMTTNNPRGYWDWWVIGGRWSGVLDPSYDPSMDPRNFETCRLCGGTGRRNDQLGQAERRRNPRYGCNGCEDTGTARKFSNAPHGSNVMKVADIPADVASGFALITPDGEWHAQGRMGWFCMSEDDMDDEAWLAYKRAKLAEHPDAIAVVVDCHV